MKHSHVSSVVVLSFVRPLSRLYFQCLHLILIILVSLLGRKRGKEGMTQQRWLSVKTLCVGEAPTLPGDLQAWTHKASAPVSPTLATVCARLSVFFSTDAAANLNLQGHNLQPEL